MIDDQDEPRDGHIVTFYSYKGGTGRTMAAINVAYLLARGDDGSVAPRSVLVIDWDLEAPGVPKYVPGVRRDRDGLIDFFIALRARLQDGPSGRELYGAIAAADRSALTDAESRGEALVRALDAAVPLLDYVQYDVGDPSSAGRLAVLSSGQDCDAYAARVTSFDWPGFFRDYPAVFAALRERLASAFDYVIVDSRTGVTDASGICSVLLPERLVCVFTPNRQSLEGGLGMVRRAITHRRSSSLDPRPLVVYPLPSRVEMSETALRVEWRVEYQHAFEELFEELYDQSECELTEYFDETKVHHRSDYAYGEKIAVLSERDEEGSLTRVFRKFASWVESGEVPWGEVPTPAAVAAGSGARDTAPAEPLVAGERPLAPAVRKWQLDRKLLADSELRRALTWAATAAFLYPSEFELIARSLAAGQRVETTIRRVAAVGTVVVLATAIAFGLLRGRNVDEHESNTARLAAETAAQKLAVEQKLIASQSQLLEAGRKNEQVTRWLDAISRSELLLDDMDGLAFDRAAGLDLPSREAFLSASTRLDDLAQEIPELLAHLAALIAALGSTPDPAVATARDAFDPLPALQHATDRLQQAREQLEPLGEKRDLLGKLLEKGSSEPSPVSPERLAARQEWNRGYRYFLEGKYEQARLRFEAALKADPTYEGAYNSLGRLALMRGDLLAARNQLEKALANDPKHVVALSNLATLYVKQAERETGLVRSAQLESAREYVTRALELDPNYGPARRTSARIEALEGDARKGASQAPTQQSAPTGTLN